MSLGQLSTTPAFDLAVALGRVDGWENFRKFGMNNDVDAGTEYLWPPGTARTLPTVAAAASVTGGAQDVLTTGTGAWTVTVQGLDSSLLEVEETINMSGATPSLTTQTFLRINRAFVVTAGTGRVNDAAISITVGGNLQAYIEAGEGQTHQSFYTVPSNKTLIINNITITTGRSGTTDIAVLTQTRLVDADASWRSISDIQMYEGQYLNPSLILIVPSSTEIRQAITADSTNARVSSEYDGFLVDNNYL